MAELGLGKEGMATISAVMGMPLPSTQNAWDKTNKSLSNALDVVLGKQYENAAMKVRELMVEDGGAISDQSVVEVVVSYRLGGSLVYVLVATFLIATMV